MSETETVCLIKDGRTWWPDAPPRPPVQRLEVPGGSVAVRFDLTRAEVRRCEGGGSEMALSIEWADDSMMIFESGDFDSLTPTQRLEAVRHALVDAFVATLDRTLKLPDGSTPFWDGSES